MIKTKDWDGGRRSIYATIGASNHSEGERAEYDYYATDPRAIELLLDIETFNHKIWECACGEGHLAKVLRDHGYDVLATDLVARGYEDYLLDFFEAKEPWDGDIITNPPYARAQSFVEKALDLVEQGAKVAMFLKLTFLESKARRKLFEKHPPQKIYVSSSRLQCAKNGNFEKFKNGAGTAIAYGWFIWEKGYEGEPAIRWFN